MSDVETIDRRQKKTRDAIRKAFSELLFEQNYPKIKMSAVAERANIGRSTLYEHFSTKNELFREIVNAPMAALASVVGARDVPSHLEWWLQHFKDKQAIARVLLYLPARGEMVRVLAELIEARLLGLTQHKVLPLIPLKLIAAQVASVQFEILQPWVLSQIALGSSVAAKAMHLTSNAIVKSVLPFES